MADQTWQEQIIAHLELAKQVASRCPAETILDAKSLNAVLDAFQAAQNTFLVMCEVQGFKTTKKEK